MEEKVFGEDYTIEVNAKSLKAGLVQYIVKKYIQTQLFELIEPARMSAEIRRQIEENIKFEKLQVKVDFIPEDTLSMQILIDNTVVDVHVVTSGVPDNNAFK